MCSQLMEYMFFEIATVLAESVNGLNISQTISKGLTFGAVSSKLQLRLSRKLRFAMFAAISAPSNDLCIISAKETSRHLPRDVNICKSTSVALARWSYTSRGSVSAEVSRLRVRAFRIETVKLVLIIK